MRVIIPFLLVAGAWIAPAAADEGEKPHAPAEVYIFRENSPEYFFSDGLTSARFFKFSPDGKYIVVTRQHLGVWPVDRGTWSQSGDGVVTLVSPKRCADIISGPLRIQVGTDRLSLLPELLRKINAFIDANPDGEYARDDLEVLKVGKDDLEKDPIPIEVQPDWFADSDTITRAEMTALIEAIREFLKKPALRNEKFVPLSHKGEVFLKNLNMVTNRDHKRVCRAIDEGKHKKAASYSEHIYNPFRITEKRFVSGTGTPYPFKVFTEMNEITGAK